MRRDVRREEYAAFNARRHPLVLPCQTLITGNKLENRDCHNPGNESGVSSERRCRLSLSTAISRYINADGERRAVMREHEGGRAGSIPGISMPPNHRFSTYRLSAAGTPPFRPPPGVPCDLSYRSLYNSGSAGPCSRTGSNGREPRLGFCSPHASICATSSDSIFPRERDRPPMTRNERYTGGTFVGGTSRYIICTFDRVPGCNGTGSE